MPWFPVDDGFGDHPKAIAAENAAIGLWVRCGSWAKKHATGGFVPDGLAREWGTRAQARRLVDVGLWDEVLGGYHFHDWTDYGSNETAPAEEDAAQRRRAQAAERQRQKRARDRPAEPVQRDESVTVTRDTSVTGRDDGVTVTPRPSQSPVPNAVTGTVTSSIPSETSGVTSRVTGGTPASVTGGQGRTDRASPATENDPEQRERIARASALRVDFVKVRDRIRARADGEPVPDALVMQVITGALARAKHRPGDRTGLVLTSIDRDWPEWSRLLYEQESA